MFNNNSKKNYKVYKETEKYDLVKGTVWPLTEKSLRKFNVVIFDKNFKTTVYAKKKRQRIKENWKQCINKIRISVKSFKKGQKLWIWKVQLLKWKIHSRDLIVHLNEMKN